MRAHPRLMRVESGRLTFEDTADWSTVEVVDAYARVPRWWQHAEERIRLDLWLALVAWRNRDRADIIWAGSEKVGIPLSFLPLGRPLVVVAHHMSSRWKARFARAFGVVRRWDGIGHVSDEAAEHLASYFGVPRRRLFQYMAAKYLHDVSPTTSTYDGPIFSIGVAKRDYSTMIRAVSDLPDCRAEICASSLYGDQLRERDAWKLPPWVTPLSPMPEDELLEKYRRARFVVVPLHETTHTGAGISAVLEAGALGKAVVATDTGGMRTFVRHNESGLLVPPYDVQAMREAIVRLWSDPELATTMGASARRYMEERFDPLKLNAEIGDRLCRLWPQGRR